MHIGVVLWFCLYCFVDKVVSISESVSRWSADSSDSMSANSPNSVVSAVASIYAYSHNIGGLTSSGQCAKITYNNPYDYRTGDSVVCQLMNNDNLYHYIVALNYKEGFDFYSDNNNAFFTSSSESSTSSSSGYSSSGNYTFNSTHSIVDPYFRNNRKCYHCNNPISIKHFTDVEVNKIDSMRIRTRYRYWQLAVRNRATRVREMTKSTPPQIIYDAFSCNCQTVVDYVLMNYVSSFTSCLSPSGKNMIPYVKNNDVVYEYIHYYLSQYIGDEGYHRFFDNETNYETPYYMFDDAMKECIYDRKRYC